MENIIIAGCGRSGTSALAGMMHNSGYNTGDNFLPSREGNPKGFFEDKNILRTNEKILFNSYPKKFPFSGEWILDYKYSSGNLWLCRLGLNARLFFSAEIEEEIKKAIKVTPFCYKDPRFCYTLPLWKPFLKNTLFICIFRQPEITSESLVNEAKILPELKNMKFDYSTAVDLWTCMYNHILEKHYPYCGWLFIHYDQLFSDNGIKKIEKFLNLKVNRDFIDIRLKRTKSSADVPRETQNVYSRLCELSNYKKI